MNFVYSEQPNYHFPYWLDFSVPFPQDNLWKIMEINQWAGGQFGDLGVQWGYLKTSDPKPTGGAAYNLRNPSLVHHSWRFKNKEDAMVFKLMWHGK
jgi:hypothetical protein